MRFFLAFLFIIPVVAILTTNVTPGRAAQHRNEVVVETAPTHSRIGRGIYPISSHGMKATTSKTAVVRISSRAPLLMQCSLLTIYRKGSITTSGDDPYACRNAHHKKRDGRNYYTIRLGKIYPRTFYNLELNLGTGDYWLGTYSVKWVAKHYPIGTP